MTDASKKAVTERSDALIRALGLERGSAHEEALHDVAAFLCSGRHDSEIQPYADWLAGQLLALENNPHTERQHMSDEEKLLEAMAEAKCEAIGLRWRDIGNAAYRDFLAQADATLAVIHTAGYRVVPAVSPYPQEYIVQGVRTVNGDAYTVLLSWSDESGGWHQWTKNKAQAKRFAAADEALHAAVCACGPIYLEPERSSVIAIAVNSRKTATYTAMLDASPIQPTGGKT